MEANFQYKISEKTVLETKRCQKDFSCLKGQHEELCKIESCVNGKVHFVKCLSYTNCSYKGPYGDGFICYCPTRKELFNTYGI